MKRDPQTDWKTFRLSGVNARIAAYSHHFACFACRKMFKRHADKIEGAALCPQCRTPMTNMGIGFRPPKSSDVKAWREVERQAKAGRRFWFVPSWL